MSRDRTGQDYLTGPIALDDAPDVLEILSASIFTSPMRVTAKMRMIDQLEELPLPGKLVPDSHVNSLVAESSSATMLREHVQQGSEIALVQIPQLPCHISAGNPFKAERLINQTKSH